MIIKWTESEGVVHEWNWSGAPKTQEGRFIKQRMNWSTTKFLEALGELDPDAVIGLIVILSARDGRKLSWDDVNIDPINDLEWIPTEEELAKVEIQDSTVGKLQGFTTQTSQEFLDVVKPLEAEVTGQAENGHLVKAVLNPRSEHTRQNSGHVSD